MTLLDIRSLVAGHHGVAAVHELNLTVDAGEVVALLGPNGAGKTTTLLTVSGELPVLGGEVRFDGEVLAGPLHRRARRGIALVTEDRCIFRQLTVQENIAIGRGSAEYVYELAPELHPLRDRKVGLLSGGEQQILALARALAARPRLLLADELSLGLAPRMAEHMLTLARHAADEGVAVLLVEQQVTRALGVADRAYVLGRGRVRVSGSADDMRTRLGELTNAYALAPSD